MTTSSGGQAEKFRHPEKVCHLNLQSVMRWTKGKQVDKRFAENRQRQSQQFERLRAGDNGQHALTATTRTGADLSESVFPLEFFESSTASDDLSTMSLGDVCRICLRSSECERLCAIFDSIIPKIDSPPTAVIELWKIFNELLISSDVDLPDKICFDCLKEIQGFYLFMLKCEKADAFLKQLKNINQICSNSSPPPKSPPPQTKRKKSQKGYDEFVVHTVEFERSGDSIESGDAASNICQIQIKEDEESQDTGLRSIDMPGMDSNEEKDDDDDEVDVIMYEESSLDNEEEEEDRYDDDGQSRSCDDDKSDLAAQLRQIIMGTTSFAGKGLEAEEIEGPLDFEVYECRECYYRCDRREDMRRHMMDCHSNESIVRKNPIRPCPDCMELQSTSDKRSKGAVRCERCWKRQETENDMVLTPFKSSESGTDSMKTTEMSTSSGGPSTDDDLKQSTTPHFVKYINREGKVIKVWECGICSRNFQHQYTLMRHLPTHTNVRNFICNECGKAFRQLSTLSQHRAIHSVDRPYACETCNKSFNRISTLISHRKTHSDVKPFRCHMCHKGFHQKGNLRNHIYIHTNERPYRCSFCNKGFNQMSNLVCHTQKSHSSEFGSIWTCHRCNMSFSKRTLLRAHELETHHIQGSNTRSNRSKLVNPRKMGTITGAMKMDEMMTGTINHLQQSQLQQQQQQQQLQRLSTGATTISTPTQLPTDCINEPSSPTSTATPTQTNCKSEISENGILIPAIETDAMKTAKANKEMPFAVLHFFEGLPLLVRILDYGQQSLLRPANSEDFASLRNQQTDATEKVSVPIVAAVYQTLNVTGRPDFTVMPPKNIYKFINQQISINPDGNCGGEEENKIMTPKRPPAPSPTIGATTTVLEKSLSPTEPPSPVGNNVISLTPPQIPSDLRDVTAGNLETPLFETLTSVKDEPASMDDGGMEYGDTEQDGEKPRAIAIEEPSYWKKQNKEDDGFEEPDDFSETFQNIATGNLLTPKKITEPLYLRVHRSAFK